MIITAEAEKIADTIIEPPVLLFHGDFLKKSQERFGAFLKQMLPKGANPAFRELYEDLYLEYQIYIAETSTFSEDRQKIEKANFIALLVERLEEFKNSHISNALSVQMLTLNEVFHILDSTGELERQISDSTGIIRLAKYIHIQLKKLSVLDLSVLPVLMMRESQEFFDVHEVALLLLLDFENKRIAEELSQI